MSDVILIAGYYRSGTSALSGALYRLGVTFHNDADPNEHNPLGFYEIPELIEFDVDLFARLGVEWTDVGGLPASWWERADICAYLARLEEILRRRFAGEALWGLKHPHLCRLLPLYEQAVTQAGGRAHVIHICRQPLTIAASQQRKNGLSRAHAVLLWLTYLFAAERNARHLPRCWLTYEDLLNAPGGQIERIERELGIELRGRVPDGVTAAGHYLTQNLNRAEMLPLADLAQPLRGLVERVWEAVTSRDFAAATWDGFVVEADEIVRLLKEFGASRGKLLANLLAVPPAVVSPPDRIGLRPAERLDDGAKRRLFSRAEAFGTLPPVSVIIAAPARRAHAINETLASLRQQWRPSETVCIVSVEPVEIPGIVTIPAPESALTARLCEVANGAAGGGYVALINSGDTLAPDACLRFALTAAETEADLIYSDEIVPNDTGGWIRHKPGWDITRLRQSAYLGDWVWYRAATIRRIGGFDADFAGAEEYELQLRLAETGAKVVRLPEAVFSRAALSRRDNIPAPVFGARAQAAVAAHLHRVGIPATVLPRGYVGLFRHERAVADPGTTIILLCDHADVAALDRWMKVLLTDESTGPIILAGAGLGPQTCAYLAQVSAGPEALRGKVLAVPPDRRLTPARALALALAEVASEHVMILDAACLPLTADWRAALRSRFADPGVALAGARALVKGSAASQEVLGPIVIGAAARLGAGHSADDPGPGGWLVVDQEASAIAPPLLARRLALAACVAPAIAGDALWADLCDQIRAQGARIVWTPDVSFAVPASAEQADWSGAGAHCWADTYHHPALALQGDLLAAEPRLGLVRAAPADPETLLLSGDAEAGVALLNAARALRAAGRMEASWAPEPLLPAEIGRRDPAVWVRINPEFPGPGTLGYIAVFTAAPAADAAPAIAGARHVMATSPALATRVRRLAGGRPVTLWRPALSGPVWAELHPASGLNTKPRVLWIDEGIEPSWLADLINETRGAASWIVVERPGVTYSGEIARLRRPADEQGWARELGALAPHILVRPAGDAADADHYCLLIAAAAGCHALVDDRLDMPAALGAAKLPNRMPAWREALAGALQNLSETLARGRAAREAALTLPTIEAAPPAWAVLPAGPVRSAAE